MSSNGNALFVPKLRFPEFWESGGWQERRLGNEGEFLTALTGKSGSDFDSGEAKFITYMNVFSNTFVDPNDFRYVNVAEGERQNAVAQGDVFFTISSESPEDAGMSSVLLIDIENCYLNSFCTLFRFYKEKALNAVFAGYLFRQPTVRSYFGRRAQGSTRFNLSKNAFNTLPLLIPPASEQQKIADCLSSLDKLIAAQARKLSALKTQKKGLMQQLFPSEGKTQPRLRFSAFQNTNEWKKESLRNLCARVMDGTHFSPKSKEGPRPYLTSKNIKDGRIDLAMLSRISEEEHAEIYSKCPVKYNDVLLTKDGANTGNCALNNLDFEFSLLSSVAVLQGDPRKIRQEFLFQSILSDSVQSMISESMSGQAITRITLAKIGGFAISVTSTVEQQRVADCLSSLDALINAQTEQLENLETHKQGLMQQLFPLREN